ncbi:hypothetical protein [Pengzhenrongella frigida]|uniref:Glycosyl transferase n=1 Tax=Pengzhenrongella frigida TaxID=1259133 RepID=A0A4Q5N030_9MICO|nr:hypothetical protein [Cellulomonas sp. HLT2-17]RYV50563.1 hypothetical protein EUA98_13085 [Cellulomonas sp. HLT2-17]
MSTSVGRRLIAALAAAAATTGARPALDLLVGDQTRWTRTNHRGEPVSMLEGPAAAVGLLVGGVVGAPSARAALAATVATAGGVAFGLVDDLTEDRATRTKGLRGHLGALAHGELTTGGLKVLGIGVSALAAAAIATRRRSTGGWLFDVATSGALIAASANLVNLLDLRPGRALKATALAAAPLAITGGPAAGLAAGVIGVCAGAAPGDLAERDMLGDSGANALGALLGTAVVLGSPRSVRLGLLAGAVGLTVASERVSFTKVIATTPVLRELDAWGRRPVPSPGTAGPAADLAADPTE